MASNLPDEGFVRSRGAAIIAAIPGFTFLSLYLWLAVALVAGIMLGITGSFLVSGIVAVVLGIPAVVLTWRIILACVDAEQRTL